MIVLWPVASLLAGLPGHTATAPGLVAIAYSSPASSSRVAAKKTATKKPQKKAAKAPETAPAGAA